MKKHIITSFVLISFVMSNAQIVNIPDANLKAYLTGNPSINTNMDTEIQTSEALAYTDTINISALNILDMTGIEAFINIVGLNCSDNNVTSLDVSNNLALTYLDCSSFGLTSLDLSNNVALKYINCSGNMIDMLDCTNNTALEYLECIGNMMSTLKLNNCSALKSLYCFANELNTLEVTDCIALQILDIEVNNLISLDLSNNALLEYLNCKMTHIHALDLSNNPALTYLDCSNIYELATLNISNNTLLEHLDCAHCIGLISLFLNNNSALTYLDCGSNNLYSLDISYNTALSHLNCGHNQISSLDFSNNSALTYVDCAQNECSMLDVSNNPIITFFSCSGNNPLSILNVKNGNNINFTQFYANNCDSLYCIEVDNSGWSTTNWTIIDSQAYFSEDCDNGIYNEIKNSNIDVCPNPFKDNIFISLPADIANPEVLFFNEIGKLIYASYEKINKGIKINGSNLKPGIYFVELKEQNKFIGKVKIIRE